MLARLTNTTILLAIEDDIRPEMSRLSICGPLVVVFVLYAEYIYLGPFSLLS
jgi:hypothetical protein